MHAVKNEPRTAGLVRLATLLGALSCPAGLWLLSSSGARSGWVLLGLGMSCFAAHGAPEHIAQRWFAKTPEQARKPQYTLNPQGLIVVSDLSRQVYGWPELYGFQVVPEALLVWVSARLFLIIPKRAFSAHDLPRVIEQLERQVGAPPPLPRFWTWLFLAVALITLGLWLWDRLSPR